MCVALVRLPGPATQPAVTCTPASSQMGLGKTVQVIAFLAGLQYTGLYRPSLVVCPATVLRQWMREVRRWAPAFRVVMLHDSARSPGTDPRPNK